MTSLLHSTRFLNLLQRDGWVFATRNKTVSDAGPTKPNAAAICSLITAPDGTKRVVIIKEFRRPLAGFEISFPAGLIDAGESVEQTAKREMLEETGLEFQPLLVSPLKLASSAGLTDELCPIVFGTASGNVSLTPGVDGEQIEVLLLTQEQLRSLLLNTEYYFGGRSWGILYALAHQGTFGPLSF
jgi:ADP-ribose pyrophosphatase